jgi:hypothetical protein
MGWREWDSGVRRGREQWIAACGLIHEFQYHGVESTALAARNCGTTDVPGG